MIHWYLPNLFYGRVIFFYRVLQSSDAGNPTGFNLVFVLVVKLCSKIKNFIRGLAICQWSLCFLAQSIPSPLFTVHEAAWMKYSWMNPEETEVMLVRRWKLFMKHSLEPTFNQRHPHAGVGVMLEWIIEQGHSNNSSTFFDLLVPGKLSIPLSQCIGHSSPCICDLHVRLL